MIAPHTVFLLQFAKYRPDCTQPRVTPAADAVAPAPKKVPAARSASPIRRLFKPSARLVSAN